MQTMGMQIGGVEPVELVHVLRAIVMQWLKIVDQLNIKHAPRSTTSVGPGDLPL